MFNRLIKYCRLRLRFSPVFRWFTRILPIACVLLPGLLKGAAALDSVLNASDFPSLQAAVDALPDAGGVLRLPPGKFQISQPLRVTRENVRIEGSGTSSVIVNRNTNGQPALVLAPDGFATNRRLRIWRINLSDFRITGSTNSGHGILAQGVQEIFLQNLTVDHNGGHGIFLDHCYENPRVVNCMITYNGQSGLHLLGCHDIVVNANQFEENLDALRCHDGFNLTMNGNNLDDHLRHGVVIENTYGSVLSGNMIEECNGTAIILDRDVYGITVSANVLAHNMGGGVYAMDAHGCAISANTFTLLHTNSIYIGPRSGRLTITGNNFCNSYIGQGAIRRKVDREKDKRSIQWDIGNGITIDGAADIVISGNVFSGMDREAIRGTDGARRILVNGNIFTDLHRHSKPGKAAEFPGSDTIIQENNLFPPAGK